MLRRVHIDGIPFPKLYLAETTADVRQAREHGIPYVKWNRGHDEFVKYLLRPSLERLFPGIKWDKVLGRKKKIRSDVIMVHGSEDDGQHEVAEYDADEMLKAQLAYDPKTQANPEPDQPDGTYTRTVDIAIESRECCNDNSELGYNTFVEDRLSVFEYIGDISSYVDIDVLQQLKLLPKFVGDIAECIRKNLSDSMYWTEGYNKKLGFPLGNIKSHGCLPNLIIIDCSWSIPDGIAATMLTLADTLREQCNADLIITSARSGYYPVGAELPDVQTLRNYYGRSNEAAEFFAILDKYIAGREFGHVISFGDDDNPGYWENYHNMKHPEMQNTKVHAVHHYHTWQPNTQTGYAKWVHRFCDPEIVEFNTSWANIMKDRR